MKEWTEQTSAEAVEFFDSLPESEIRRRQDLASQQIALAHERLTGVLRDDAIHDLQKMQDALAASMMRRLLDA